jgi:hypothetical protein
MRMTFTIGVFKTLLVYMMSWDSWICGSTPSKLRSGSITDRAMHHICNSLV